MILSPDSINFLGMLAKHHADNFGLNSQVTSADFGRTATATQTDNIRKELRGFAKRAVNAANYLGRLPCFGIMQFRNSRKVISQLPVRKWDATYVNLAPELREECDACPLRQACGIINPNLYPEDTTLEQVPDILSELPIPIEIIDSPGFLIAFEEANNIFHLKYPSETQRILAGLPPAEVFDNQTLHPLTPQLAQELYNMMWLTDITNEEALRMIRIDISSLKDYLNSTKADALSTLPPIYTQYPIDEPKPLQDFNYRASGTCFECIYRNRGCFISLEGRTVQISKAAYLYLNLHSKLSSSSSYEEFPSENTIYAMCVPFNINHDLKEINTFCIQLLKEIDNAERSIVQGSITN